MDKDIIQHNCDFIFYYNKTDITLTVPDRDNVIILANWPNDKHIICTINNDMPITIPCHPYILVKYDANTKLVMYFMINRTFTCYIDQLNLTEDLKFLILTNKTTSEYILPIFLNNSRFDDSLFTAPQTLKDYIAQHKYDKEIFDLKEAMI